MHGRSLSTHESPDIRRREYEYITPRVTDGTITVSAAMVIYETQRPPSLGVDFPV